MRQRRYQGDAGRQLVQPYRYPFASCADADTDARKTDKDRLTSGLSSSPSASLVMSTTSDASFAPMIGDEAPSIFWDRGGVARGESVVEEAVVAARLGSAVVAVLSMTSYMRYMID